jgi:hypothetical protein
LYLRGFGFITLRNPQGKSKFPKHFFFHVLSTYQNITCAIAADVIVSEEHIIDDKKVDVKKAVPRDKAPPAARYNL